MFTSSNKNKPSRSTPYSPYMQPPYYVSQPGSGRSSAVGRIPEPRRQLHDIGSHVTARTDIRVRNLIPVHMAVCPGARERTLESNLPMHAPNLHNIPALRSVRQSTGPRLQCCQTYSRTNSIPPVPFRMRVLWPVYARPILQSDCLAGGA